jgi:SAM-dependent methyltransferase
VTGFDPEVGEAYTGHLCHGVPPDFAERNGITIVASGIEELAAEDNAFDRVFCISVIEHIPKRGDRARGMREIARILRPGGLALVSVDINLKKRIVNPLELVWESGLAFHGEVDLVMPPERFGIFNDGLQPADVFGLVLRKPETLIGEEYGDPPSMEAWQAASMRDIYPPEWPEEDVVEADQGPRLSS